MKTLESKKKALVQVLGCKVNQAEAAAMARILEQRGYQIDRDADDPALIVVNTCCVTSKAEAKSRRLINRLAKKFPSASLVVTGCLAEVNPQSVQDIADSQVCLGTAAKDRFGEFLDSGLADPHGVTRGGASECKVFGPLGSAGIPGRARAFLKVQDGCSQACTYCIVPTARGPSRSLPMGSALEEARELEAEGYREIVLTGIHLGHYGRDLEPRLTLEDLVEQLLSECSETRFRLSSVEPQEITDRLIRMVAEHPRVCRHFHIPLQSGDDHILKRMARPYNAALILDLLERIFTAVPEACVGLDVLVGFPGEDERSFRITRNLIEQSSAAYLHVFPFSPRPGTPAASFNPRVPESISTRRVEELRSLSAEMRTRFYKQFVGHTLPAVMESDHSSESGPIIVRTDNYISVLVPKPPPLRCGDTLLVTLGELEDYKVLGKIV